MANIGRDLDSDDFVDISTDATLDMSSGTNYTLQNKSNYHLWLMEYEGSGTPSKNSAATIRNRIFVRGWDSAIVSYASGNKLYAWYEDGEDGTIAIVEAP